MTRAGGGASFGKKVALPSSQELQQSLGAGKVYGFTQAQTRGMYQATGFSNPFESLPTASSKGAFFETISLLGSQDTMDYYNPQSYNQVAKRNQAGQALGPGIDQDVYYIDRDGNFVDRSSYRQSYDVDDDTGELVVPGIAGPQGEEGDAPAPITMVPTSTTNPGRPRTVAAGYDGTRQVITVVFRDGTFYNYYEVSASEWQAFKSRVSKGKYIYQELDYHPRGPANTSSIPAGVRESLYRLSRAVQVQRQGKQKATKKSSTKPKKR
jgi:hypothetical protein